MNLIQLKKVILVKLNLIKVIFKFFFFYFFNFFIINYQKISNKFIYKDLYKTIEFFL